VLASTQRYIPGDRPKSGWPRIGRNLYYKDKRTGEIGWGMIRYVRPKEFNFIYNDARSRRWIDRSLLDSRLFFKKEDDEKFGKTAEMTEG